MSKWTPGPWVVGNNINGTNYNANIVYSPRSEAHMDVGIAQVYGIPMHRGLHEIEDCEGLANARLIAAAPRMAAFIQSRADAGDAEAAKIMEEINGVR